MAAFQLISLFVILILISGVISKKTPTVISLATAFLFSLVTMLQVVSYYTTAKPFNYQVYIHLQLDSVNMAMELFGYQIVILLVLSFILFLAYFFSGKFLSLLAARISLRGLNIGLVALGLICLTALIVPHEAILRHTYLLAQNLAVTGSDMELAHMLSSYGIEHYVKREDISASAGKNVVIISLESFERGFFDPVVFRDVAPNLREMSESWTFFPHFSQSPGAGWTSGALYSLHTAMPAYFGMHGNKIFHTATGTRLAGLGDVFKAAGYEMIWFMSDPAHAGNARLLDHYHFDVFHTPGQSLIDFRMSDADLFANAKAVINEFRAQGKPFFLGLSTMSTHHPDGIPDENFKHMKKSGDSGIRHMARVTDYLVKDFCDFVLNQSSNDDTVIYILPDHLAMSGNSALDDLESLGERSLFLLTNAPVTVFGKKTTDSINTLDLPRLILRGANVDSNITFITESLAAEKLDQSDFTSLNLRLWSHHNINDGIAVEFFPTGEILVSANGNLGFRQATTLEVLENGNVVIYDRGQTSNLLIRLDPRENSVCLATQGKMLSCFKGKKSYLFSKQEIEFAQAMHMHGKVNDFLHHPKHLTIGSSTSLLAPSFLVFGDFRVNFREPGLVLIYRDSLKTQVFNSMNAAEQPELLIRVIEAGIKEDNLLAILVHGDITDITRPVLAELERLNLPRLARLAAGNPYIALHAHDGAFLETDDVQEQLVLKIPYEYQITSSHPDEVQARFIEEFSSDHYRYIAHAGGAIEGKTYTNSLEALNRSYQAGYRLFELDIITTSDEQFVAAHDWEHWAKITNYNAVTPPTREEFMKQQIFDVFTPMDLEAINRWFSNHPDAVLVTDKVNDPLVFAASFVDKNRLMMELFSEQALKAAQSAGITALCNIAVVQAHYRESGELAFFLQKYDIQAIALPIGYVDHFPTLIRYLSDNGVRSYGYTANDAEFIGRHIGTTLYGVYTDNWALR